MKSIHAGFRVRLNAKGRRHSGGSRCNAKDMAKRLGTITGEHPLGHEWRVWWDGCKASRPMAKAFVEIVEGTEMAGPSEAAMRAAEEIAEGVYRALPSGEGREEFTAAAARLIDRKFAPLADAERERLAALLRRYADEPKYVLDVCVAAAAASALSLPAPGWDEELAAEQDAIIACIRSTTWGGSEEIVAMIRQRSMKKGQ